MQLVCILVIVSGILTELPYEGSIITGRILFGMAAGSITVYVPKYVEEVSPKEHKGTLGTYFQLILTFGIFLGPLIALPIPNKPACAKPITAACQKELDDWGKDWYVNYYWHVMFALPIITSVIQLVLLTVVYPWETPNFYKERGQTDKLHQLMNRIYSADIV